MKSKAEISQEHHMIQHGLSVGKAQSHADFTLEYAESVAIGFYDWIMKNGIQRDGGGYYAMDIKNNETPYHYYERRNICKLTEDLYNLYKQTLK